MKIRTLADIVALEQLPVTERIQARNVFDLLSRAAVQNAGRTAIRCLSGTGPDDPVREVTFDALLGHTIQAANLFHANGVGPDDTVTLLMPSVAETFFALWGAEIAAVANPVNYFLNASQIAGIMKEAGARALVAADASIFPDIWPKVEEIRKAIPGLKVFRVGGTSSLPGVIDFEAAAARQPADKLVAPKTLERDTLAALFHTGGTTGLPKLARHTHGALALMAWTQLLMIDTGPGSVFLNPLPQFHVGGSLVGALSPVANGWTIVIPTPLGARNPNMVRDWWSIVEHNKVTVGGAVPTSLAAIMNVPRGEHDLSSLKVFVSGGSTVPVELIRRIEREIGVPVVEGYGMTEVHCYSTMNPMQGERRAGSVGLRLPYTEVRIADVGPDGAIKADCPTGTIGHVLMRGPQVTPGYLDPRHDKGAMLADGWLDSGDLGRIDAEGYVWLTGRSKDLIIRGGHNIDPTLIEEAADTHPAVSQSAAVGMPDPYTGEVPILYVTARPGAALSPGELDAHLRRTIAEDRARPAEIVLLEALPMTPMGKISKLTLRRDAARRAVEIAIASPVRSLGIATAVEMAEDTAGRPVVAIAVRGCPEARRDAAAVAIGKALAPFAFPSSTRFD